LDASEDLAVLRSFADLEELTLEHVRGVDLRPLTGLGVERLTITEAVGVDLTPLAALPQLFSLILGNLDDIEVAQLTLAPSLRLLVVINDDPMLTGEPVRRLIKAIDWSRLAGLRSLSLRVGGLYEMPPIAVDFGFLRCLPKLERLDMYAGLRHAGPSRAPTEPPFDGLSRDLTALRISGDEPASVRTALCKYLGADPDDPQTGIVVSDWPESDEPAPTALWAISGPVDGVWTAYGSLHRAEDAASEGTEHEACERAETRLRKLDAALVERLDLDPESAGTGIMAKSRADLERALALLELAPPMTGEVA